METVTNGEFSEEPTEKDKILESSTDPAKTLESVGKENSDRHLTEDVSKDVQNTEKTAVGDSSEIAVLPTPNSNAVNLPKASDLESNDNSHENNSKSLLITSEACLTDSPAPSSSVVDSLTLLNNSVQSIPSLFNKDKVNDSTEPKPIFSVSSVGDLPKSSDVNLSKGNSTEKLDQINELSAQSSGMDLSSKASHKDDSNYVGDKSSEKKVCESDPSLPGTDLALNRNKSSSEEPESCNSNSNDVVNTKDSAPCNDSKSLENGAQDLSVKACASNNVGNDADKLETEVKEKDLDNLAFDEISNEETGFPEMFTGLVTVGKYISVKGDFTLRSSEALVESPSLAAPFLLKEPDIFPAREVPLKNDSKGFFFSAAGELLIGIGLSRVSEWFHRDMIKIKKRQMKKDGKTPQVEDELRIHEEFFAESKKANKMYSFPLKVCKTCGFSTESAIAMEGHLLIPHLNSVREFECNFCNITNKDPRSILEHMFRIHAKTGRIQPPNAFFECPYCTFETNSKVKLANHLPKCTRCFDSNRNQAPPKDFEFPALTPKPITVAVVKAYEKSLSTMQRGRGRPKKMDSFNEQMSPFASVNQMSPIGHGPVPNYRPNSNPVLSEGLANLTNQLLPHMQMPNISLRPPPAHPGMNQFRSGLNSMHLSSNRLFQGNSSPMMSMMGNNSFVTSPSQFSFNPSANSGKKSSQSPNLISSMFGTSARQQQNSPNSSSDVTITPLPKLQGPYPVPHIKTSVPPSSTSLPGHSLVVCEICDGYIKDLEQLRSHMQLIHKVKIHPKMLVSRPPLNCQKCQWRFFTDQGLERHLLGSHGLVTSNMQELANKGKDAGCCTICGRVYASKLVSHMNQVHKLTLKPAHLSYKCTVCSATFNLYRLFENHVYLVHSGAAKRSSDSGGSNPAKKTKSGDVSDKGNYSEEQMMAESFLRCKDCGKEFIKVSGQGEKCEKCLSFDRQGLLKGIVS